MSGEKPNDRIAPSTLRCSRLTICSSRLFERAEDCVELGGVRARGVPEAGDFGEQLAGADQRGRVRGRFDRRRPVAHLDGEHQRHERRRQLPVHDPVGGRAAGWRAVVHRLEKAQPLGQIVQQAEQVGDVRVEQAGARREFFGRQGGRDRVPPKLLKFIALCDFRRAAQEQSLRQRLAEAAHEVGGRSAATLPRGTPLRSPNASRERPRAGRGAESRRFSSSPNGSWCKTRPSLRWRSGIDSTEGNCLSGLPTRFGGGDWVTMARPCSFVRLRHGSALKPMRSKAQVGTPGSRGFLLKCSRADAFRWESIGRRDRFATLWPALRKGKDAMTCSPSQTASSSAVSPERERISHTMPGRPRTARLRRISLCSRIL